MQSRWFISELHAAFLQNKLIWVQLDEIDTQDFPVDISQQLMPLRLTFRYMPTTSHFDRALAKRQANELGVIDISDRNLHLVRGIDRCGRNDIYQSQEMTN